MFELRHLNNSPQPDAAPNVQPAGSGAGTAEKDKKVSRTTGLKVFDAFLYPFFTNFVVFAISVVATYLTSAGDKTDENGKLIYGKTGKFFHERGAWLVKQFEKMGMDHKTADMGKVVFFSFFDGSLIAPFVKLFEDRREKIGKWVDDKLGTKPQDDSIYAAEPKQTWGSVLWGRVATLSVVLPVATMLSKLGTKDGKLIWNNEKNVPGFNSMNDILFSNPGKKVGEWLEREHPEIAKKLFGKLNVPELSKIGFFEAFYTSVCTAGLYFSSRFFAGLKDKNKATEPAAPASQASDSAIKHFEKAMENYKNSSLLEGEAVANKPTVPAQTNNFSAEALAGIGKQVTA